MDILYNSLVGFRPHDRIPFVRFYFITSLAQNSVLRLLANSILATSCRENLKVSPYSCAYSTGARHLSTGSAYRTPFHTSASVSCHSIKEIKSCFIFLKIAKNPQLKVKVSLTAKSFGDYKRSCSNMLLQNVDKINSSEMIDKYVWVTIHKNVN